MCMEGAVIVLDCIIFSAFSASGTPVVDSSASVVLYFSLSRVLDRETVSWVCIVGAAPVAAAGFFQYNGLTLERFLWAWLKSEVIMAGKRVWRAENY